MHIDSLWLRVYPTDLQPINSIVENPNFGPGTYHINSSEGSINLFNQSFSHMPIAGTIGRVGINVVGDLVLDDNGGWSFNGDMGVLPDVYNVDVSNRPWPQEALTDFLRYLGDRFGHVDYTIEFVGRTPIYGSGTRF